MLGAWQRVPSEKAGRESIWPRPAKLQIALLTARVDAAIPIPKPVGTAVPRGSGDVRAIVVAAGMSLDLGGVRPGRLVRVSWSVSVAIVVAVHRRRAPTDAPAFSCGGGG